MIACNQMHAVWKSTDDYKCGKEPICVTPTEEAAWAVYNLINPKLVNGSSSGPYPVKDRYYVFNVRPDLAEDFEPAPSARGLDLSDDLRDSQEAARENAAYRQRRLGYYA